jgi:hypothetical protein
VCQKKKVKHLESKPKAKADDDETHEKAKAGGDRKAKSDASDAGKDDKAEEAGERKAGDDGAGQVKERQVIDFGKLKQQEMLDNALRIINARLKAYCFIFYLAPIPSFNRLLPPETATAPSS